MHRFIVIPLDENDLIVLSDDLVHGYTAKLNELEEKYQSAASQRTISQQSYRDYGYTSSTDTEQTSCKGNPIDESATALSISSDSGTSDWATRISENRNERDLVSGDTEETASTISCNIAIGDKYNLNIPPWQEVRRKDRRKNIFTNTTNESISDFDSYNKMIDAQKYPNEHYLDSHVNNKATNFEYETNEKKITKTALTCCHMH